MKYKIGDVAKLLGLTTEAIRYYEDQGIIKPTKSEETGYRYYGVWELHMLIRARSYRQYGYSLAETAELINHFQVPDIVSSLAKKEADIENAITWQLNYLKHIRQMQNIITDAAANMGKFRIEYRPPMYRISVQDGYKLYSDAHHRKLYHSWIDNVPFVLPSAVFKKSWIEKGDSMFSFGLGVDAEYADLLGIKETADVAFFPSCLCIYTALLSCSGTALSPKSLNPAIDYMRSQGMKLGGDVVTRVVLVNKTEEDYFSWHQLWLPIS